MPSRVLAALSDAGLVPLAQREGRDEDRLVLQAGSDHRSFVTRTIRTVLIHKTQRAGYPRGCWE